jgi:hypothetical protein
VNLTVLQESANKQFLNFTPFWGVEGCGEWGDQFGQPGSDKGPYGSRNESESNPDPELLVNLSDEPCRKRMLGTMLGTIYKNLNYSTVNRNVNARTTWGQIKVKDIYKKCLRRKECPKHIRELKTILNCQPG